uniref:NADH dehydrogenase subunit 6 n=1 Tax=Parapoynx fluctuosalis TaxID=1557973 RepID=UPI002A809B79|nr:NADH dehydrogenase subunit 6 [Parapoynx fluctuosalis]WNN67133.1 NADH dehydrogenase subunit 6 [Parapoynx fluctuosalis]
MLKMFLSLMIIMTSIMMFFFNHPLSMGLMILYQTFMMCLISSMLISTYWFSYILFLTFLGGLLVLFIYVSSLASNEMFKISFNLKFLFLLNFMIIIIISYFNMFNLNWLNFSNDNIEMSKFFNLFIYFNNENKINLSKLYNNQTFLLLIMMVIYLFITLIAVVKITNIFYGPLRPSY